MACYLGGAFKPPHLGALVRSAHRVSGSTVCEGGAQWGGFRAKGLQENVAEDATVGNPTRHRLAVGLEQASLADSSSPPHSAPF